LMRRGSLMRRNKSLATGFPTNLSDPTPGIGGRCQKRSAR
jgi:hypothetical protein